MTFVWTDEAVAELKKCIADRMSAGQTAAHIRAHFEGDPSRNAIIGKALRLKLSWHNLPNREYYSQFEKQRRAKITKPAKLNSRATAAPALPVEAPRAIPPAPNSKPVDLMGLTNATCRWPITDDSPHMFCGALEANMKDGVLYCPMHSAAATGRAYTRQERFEFRRRSAA